MSDDDEDASSASEAEDITAADVEEAVDRGNAACHTLDDIILRLRLEQERLQRLRDDCFYATAEAHEQGLRMGIDPANLAGELDTIDSAAAEAEAAETALDCLPSNSDFLPDYSTLAVAED